MNEKILVRSMCVCCDYCNELETKDCEYCKGSGEVEEWMSLADAVQSVINIG